MAQISSQLAYVSASRQLKRAQSLTDIYICPPLHQYSIFDFHKRDEITQIGYEHGKEELKRYMQTNANIF